MLLGITGTDGSGKGKTVRGTVLEGCQIFSFENIDNLYSDCKSPVPELSLLLVLRYE